MLSEYSLAGNSTFESYSTIVCRHEYLSVKFYCFFVVNTMEDLRKSAISGSLNSGPSSGASTPVRMEKTDSVVNLTKPELYSLYRDESVLNLNLEDDLVILEKKKMEEATDASAREGQVHSNISIVNKLLVLGLSSYIYCEITKHININHFGESDLIKNPLNLSNKLIFSVLDKFNLSNYIAILSQKDFQLVNHTLSCLLQGIFMSSVVPILDSVLPKSFSKRLLSSNPNGRQQNLTNELVRSSIMFLGISYAIRKLEWNNFLQVSIVWSLLNPSLWLLLDGTITGFLASLFISAGACSIIYFENSTMMAKLLAVQPEDTLATWLWIGSFFFCGLIIFGKIGRGLI